MAEERIVRGSPLEGRLYILRRRVRAQPFVEASAIGDLVNRDEESDTEADEPSEEETSATSEDAVAVQTETPSETTITGSEWARALMIAFQGGAHQRRDETAEIAAEVEMELDTEHEQV
jgi:hypothetical protein